MERIDAARRYYDRLAAGDGDGAAQLFTEDGVIDDFGGNHHVGHAAIAHFISTSVRAGALKLEVPVRSFEEGARLNVYGRATMPTHFDGTLIVRWVFHFRGDRIEYLCNSRVDRIPDCP